MGIEVEFFVCVRGGFVDVVEFACATGSILVNKYITFPQTSRLKDVWTHGFIL